MKALTARQLAVLRSAPIGVDIDHGNGDPSRTPRFRYQGVDGRIAQGLWGREFLAYRPSNPLSRSDGGVLVRTRAGDEALSRAGAA